MLFVKCAELSSVIENHFEEVICDAGEKQRATMHALKASKMFTPL